MASTTILSNVRKLLTRRWIDVQHLRIRIAKDTVRLAGRLSRLGGDSWSDKEPPRLDVLESELKRLEGIKRVCLEFDNWIRNESGQWEPAGKHDRRHFAKRFVIRRRHGGCF